MSESTIKKTAEQLNHVLNGLSDYLMAEVSVVEGEKPYLNLRLLDVEKDEELEFSPESVTLPQACREIEAYADSYDAEEEREVYDVVICRIGSLGNNHVVIYSREGADSNTLPASFFVQKKHASIIKSS